MAGKAISVQITGDYNNRDVNRAIKDLELLKTQGAGTTTAMGGLQRGMRSLMPSMQMVGLMAGAAAVAAAGMAVKFGVDSVKAFMEDEAAAAKLATTLNNLGFSKATPEVEAMIDAQQRLTGIADTELRPAFDRLVRATRDVGEASRLLVLAQDVAVGTTTDLSTVTAALSKAAIGSNTALLKLGTGLSAADLKANTFEQNMAKLSQVFQGQAQTAAQTYEGQLGRLSIAFGELQESFGRGFLLGLGATNNATNELMITLKNLEPTFQGLGQKISENIVLIGNMTVGLKNLGNTVPGLNSLFSGLFMTLPELLARGSAAFRGLAALVTLNAEAQHAAFLDMTGQTAAIQVQKTALGKLKGEYITASGAIVGFVSAEFEAEDAVGQTTNAIIKQFAAMSALDSQRQDAGTRGIVNAVADDNLRLAAAADAAAEALAGAGGGGGGAAAATDKLAKAQERLETKLKTAREAVTEATKTFTDYRDSVAEGLNGLLDLGEAYETFTDRQTKLAQAQKELTDFQSKIVGDATESQVADLAKLQTAYQDASAAAASGSQNVVEEFEAQGRKLAEFGSNLSKLVANGLGSRAFNAIRSMSAERGAEVAAALTGGIIKENVDRINSVYDSVNAMALNVGNQAAIAFERVGLLMAKTMIETMLVTINGKGRAKLKAMIDDLNAAMNAAAAGAPMPVAGSGGDLAGQFEAGRFTASGIPQIGPIDFAALAQLTDAQIFGRAEGGPVIAGRSYVVGEVGPELFTPSTSGNITPNSAMGGNTYQITVQAGVGDPRAIGQQIVEYVKRFEKANGPVFAAA